MKIDVEGHELEVLRGMKDSLLMPDVICIEYSVVGLDKINRILIKEYGYSFDFVNNNNAFFSFMFNKEDLNKKWFGETDLWKG